MAFFPSKQQLLHNTQNMNGTTVNVPKWGEN